jgi:hypothetical protein
LLAAAETPGGQSGQGFLDIRQFLAGSDRAAEQPSYLVRACMITGAVVSQGQLGDFLQPRPPPGLQ